MKINKLILIIFLIVLFIPILVDADDLYSCDICSEKGIPEYYIDNLKIGQEFNIGDVIYRYTPPELLSQDPDAIYKLFPLMDNFGYFTNIYSFSAVFDDFMTGGTSFSGFIVGYPKSYDVRNCLYSSLYNGTCIYDSYDEKISFDKNVYWKLERFEEGIESVTFFFKSYHREINISITNKVNSLDKYKANKDELLLYSVSIHNSGDGYSENNIISTVVPKGLEVDKTKISDNGTYNEDKNIITWNLDELWPNGEYTFNYYAKVIDDSISEYIGNSYITSTQVLESVHSNYTIVTIDTKDIEKSIKNPNTGTKSIIIFIFSLLGIGIISYLKYKRSLNL